MKIDKNELFSVLYNKALEGDADCGGLLAYNYFSGEGITAFDEGRPLFARTPDAKFNLANFMRVHLFTALGALKDGLDILLKEEGVQIDKMYGHGGLFKTPVVGQRIMAQPLIHRFPLWRRQVRAAHGVSHFLQLTWLRKKRARALPII